MFANAFVCNNSNGKRREKALAATYFGLCSCEDQVNEFVISNFRFSRAPKLWISATVQL
jgi:hypothetical protein